MSVANGVQGDAESSTPSISDDGRYVAFRSAATTFGPGHVPGSEDVWLADAQTGGLRQLNLTPAGAPSASGDYSDPAISANGRVVAFDAMASDLVPGVPSNTVSIYVRQVLGDEPTISLQPVSLSVPAQQAFTLHAAATGDPTPALQWQAAPAGGQFADVPGATGDTLTLTAGDASTTGTSYRLVATNALGTAASSAAVVTVVAPPAVGPTKAKATITAKTVKAKLHHSAKLRVVVKASAASGKVHLGTVTVKLGKKTVKSKVKLSKKGVATITVAKKYLKHAKTYKLSVRYNGSHTTLPAKKTVKVIVKRH